MTVVLADPGSGAGQTTLQGAYDNDPAGAQILLNTVPDPITIQAQVAGLVFEAQDVAGNPILSVRADTDEVEVDGGLSVVDAFTNAGAANSITITDNVNLTAPYIGGGILSNGTVQYSNAVWIWALLQESKTYQASAAPGFAAFTLFNALAAIENNGNFDLVQALILNNGISHRRITAGTSSTIQTVGLSNAPSTRTTIAGATMTKTAGDTAVNHRPLYSTVAGSTVNFGTSIGLEYSEPALALFGSAAGVENVTAEVAVEINALPSFGNITKRGVRSFINAASNARFIDGQGTAQSDLRGTLNFPSDLVGVQYGASNDWFEAWAGAGYKIEQNASPLEQMRKSYPVAGRMLIDWSNDMEYGINCVDGFSLGAQTGGNGNQFGNFVAGARTTQIAGEWSDFLLTQAANLTVDDAMGLVAGWTINAPSMTLGTGSVTTAGALNVGGNVNQGSVNRFGVRILSNPSGGSGVNAGLWVTAGLSRFDGRVDINNGVALGGGAAATLGTIGGSGPTAAAQAQWVEIDIGGTAHWIPVWT